ncbi:hypothetical protein BDR03DRAFT_955744 [Suillus americanus]|nr:hypothetical protein BDR03DRAFT_955744 [Suillus americanus]
MTLSHQSYNPLLAMLARTSSPVSARSSRFCSLTILTHSAGVFSSVWARSKRKDEETRKKQRLREKSRSTSY